MDAKTLATYKRRLAERIELYPQFWPDQAPSITEGLFLDLALEAPWETRFKELPRAPELTELEYQRYYLVFIDALEDPKYWKSILQISLNIRKAHESQKTIPTQTA